MYLKKRIHGLPITIKPQEIVLVVMDAVDLSFMNKEKILLVCCKRGIYPFNRNPLDDPEVIRSAPDNVWLERTVVLQCRGTTHKAILPSETNLLDLGSVHLAGGVNNATESLAQTLHDLNHMNATTANIFKLAELAKNTAVRRMRHNTHASTVTSKEYQRRYKSAPRLTSNVIFGADDGILGKYARDDSIRRQKVRLERCSI
jgi:hypothetical protein